jgi:hypothetical protein
VYAGETLTVSAAFAEEALFNPTTIAGKDYFTFASDTGTRASLRGLYLKLQTGPKRALS